jgi:hypothetical protein
VTNLVTCGRIISEILKDFMQDHNRPNHRVKGADDLLWFPAKKLLNKWGKWSNVRQGRGLENGQLGDWSDSRLCMQVDDVWIREWIRERAGESRVRMSHLSSGIIHKMIASGVPPLLQRPIKAVATYGSMKHTSIHAAS